MREANNDIIILLIIAVIAYVRPVQLTNFFNSEIGRILLIGCIALATTCNIMYGIYGVILLIIFREGSKKEGMSVMDKIIDKNAEDEDEDMEDEDEDMEDEDEDEDMEDEDEDEDMEDEDMEDEDEDKKKKKKKNKNKKKKNKNKKKNKKSGKEGLTNINMSQDMTADDWKKKYCKSGKVFLNNNEVPSEEFAKKFPELNFVNGQCNPCDSNCLFKITSSKSRLDREENIKPKPSGSIPISF